MTIDYLSEMSAVLENSIPWWFYELPVEDRNTIVGNALTQYESVTIAKNNAFLTYWADLIAPYQPSN